MSLEVPARAGLSLSIVIPTYRREQVLVDTIEHLLALDVPPGEIIIVDQSERHEAAVEARLEEMDRSGAIRWIRGLAPSIPGAMNRGLLEAVGDYVLFLDDDLIPEPGLVTAHLDEHAREQGVICAGRVIQPWEEGRDFSADEHFHFACQRRHWVREFMGGNFSLQRVRAIELGGFDENFVRVAYRFEAEFSYRFLKAGGRIVFQPAACIHHLKAGGGGTRAFGEHQTTFRPDHAVGAYYYWIMTWEGLKSLRPFLRRPFLAVMTRFHLSKPWYIPLTLVAELRGIVWALWLAARGPRYVATEKAPDGG